jgi:tight adherence protein C
MVVVTVEAGTGLAASLQLAANKNAGPLGDELRLTLQEQRMGRSLHDALLGMLGRCDTPNMRAFVRSVAQGERLGVSIGTIMRNLAVEMRKARRANAEAQAQKAPVKILFPLVFLIMPAFLISILGPPLFQFTSTI